GTDPGRVCDGRQQAAETSVDTCRSGGFRRFGHPIMAKGAVAQGPDVGFSQHERRLEVGMRVGVPREVKNHEYRVALTPAGAHALASAGHEVLVETGAGLGSGIDDDAYVGAGARIVPGAEAAWAAELVCKVKE